MSTVLNLNDNMKEKPMKEKKKILSKSFYLFLLRGIALLGLISALLLFNSCATTKKSDMGYLDNSKEFNNGEKTDIQLQIERSLYELKKNPGNWRIRNNLIVLYRKKGSYKEAIKYGREILHNDSKNYVALNNLAMVYYDMKNYKYALYLLKKAISIYDEDPSSHVNLGLVFMKKGEKTLAEEEFNKAYKFNKNFYPAIKNLGYFYYETGNYELSVKYLKHVVLTEPGLKHKNMLAISYRYKGLYKEAYELYKQVLNEDPKNKLAIFNSGIIDLEYFDNPTLALEKFKRLKKMDKNFYAKKSDYSLDEYIDKAMSLKMLKENT